MTTISVIIPMYNAALSIERCLKSVLSQTYKADYQIVVVNDGSTDNSVDVVRRFAEQNSTANIELIDKPNGGASSARNIGMQAARGAWIALLDSDDEWLPEKTEIQMRTLEKHPEIDMLGCNVTTWNVKILGRKKNKLSKIKLREQFISWHPATPTLLFKREILNDVGYYDISMSHGEDGQFLIRMLMKKNCWFIPDSLVVIGGGKPTFGHSGLSANLSAMQKGQMTILDFTYKQKAINYFQYVIFKFYAILKHWRRIIITKLR